MLGSCYASLDCLVHCCAENLMVFRKLRAEDPSAARIFDRATLRTYSKTVSPAACNGHFTVQNRPQAVGLTGFSYRL